MIAKTDIDELKAKNPLDELLAERGYYPVKIVGTRRMYKSPFREESSASFSVDMDKAPGGLYFDFGSGQGGDSITLVAELEKCTKGEAIRLLRERRQ
jgi:DNA primase